MQRKISQKYTNKLFWKGKNILITGEIKHQFMSYTKLEKMFG